MPTPKRRQFLIRQKQKRRLERKKALSEKEFIFKKILPLGLARQKLFELGIVLDEVCRKVIELQKQGNPITATRRKSLEEIFANYLAANDSAIAIIQKLEPKLGPERTRIATHEITNYFEQGILLAKRDPVLSEILFAAGRRKRP